MNVNGITVWKNSISSSPFLRGTKYNHAYLQANGYINIPNAHVEANFTGDAATSSGNSGQQNSDHALHPAVCRNRWACVSDVDWFALQDVLALFTRIINDPSLLPFFAGAMSTAGWKPVNAKLAADLRKRHPSLRYDPKYFEPTNLKNNRERERIWRILRHQHPTCIQWRITRNSPSSYAKTKTSRHRSGMLAGVNRPTNAT